GDACADPREPVRSRTSADGPVGTDAPAHHDEMATPSKPAQKTARAVEGPRAGAARNQARVHGERRRGAELDRDLRLGTRPPPVWSSQVNVVRCLLADVANAAGNVRAGRPRSDHRKALALAAAQQPGRCRTTLREKWLNFSQFWNRCIEIFREIASAADRTGHRNSLSCPHQALASLGGGARTATKTRNSQMSRKGFQPGHTGRPRGTRNKLAGRVFEDILAHWC